MSPMPDPIPVMVNGIPGNMAVKVAEHVAVDARFNLLDAALTGPEITETEWEVAGKTVRLFHPDKRDDALSAVGGTGEPFVAVDYTHPDGVNGNADFYCRHRIPFVMGTTGGNRSTLEETVRNSETVAVIAPNMAKQIVGFQAMMAWAAETFPGLFKGYSLDVAESHQNGKADTSGTAKAMVAYFNRLGTPFSETEIRKERDPVAQREAWGIPEEHLGGHGWHTYTLCSEDGTVRFSFSHNVNGREIYAAGTLDAVAYLAEKVGKGEAGRVYTMIDVLKRV